MSGQGFAGMDKARQREIARQGGRAAHAKGTAHVWTREEAREAGRKGGMAGAGKRKLHVVSVTGLEPGTLGQVSFETRSFGPEQGIE